MPAAPAAVDLRGPAPLHGVVPAARGRRLLALLVDLALPLVLLAAAVAGAADRSADLLPPTSLVAAAVLVVVLTVAALCTWGRSPGRWLLGQRTVDDLTGTPVGSGRLVRRLLGSGRADLLTADLRRGRDPVAPTPAAPTLAGRPAPQQPASPVAVAAAPLPLAVHGARPSVTIELEGGERYEVVDSLLVGRSPVDPTAADRPVLSWPDLSRRLAKTHLLLEWSGQVLRASDLGSATGTTVVTAAGRQPLVPGVAVEVPPGALVVCGGRSIRVLPHG